MRKIKLSLVGLILFLLVACGTEAPAPTIEPEAVADVVEEEPTATVEPTAVPTATIAPTPTTVPTPEPFEPRCLNVASFADSGQTLPWWNDRVFYEVFVRSFYDSDGDGIGDLTGLIERLDYLNDGDPNTTDDLGVGGIWLMPINVSPSYHGYDVVDYFNVDPDYGTNEDLMRLLEEAHKRDIKVIIDLVLNHTSTRHPWFQDANSAPDAEFRDFYIFEESAPGFRSPWGSQVWHRGDDGFYYGIFWEGMPDLDYTNDEVTAEMQEVIRFWLEDIGVDGFRLDAIKHLIEDGEIQENTPETHAWFEEFHDFYTEINPDAFTVGEAWTDTAKVVEYIGDEVDIAFEFDHAGAILQSARRESALFVEGSQKQIIQAYPPGQYATFITNHDQERIMSVLLGNVGQAKTAASLLLTGPGVPFIYYGEEVGQSGRKPDENIRTPMQWADEPGAGFTTADRAWRSPQGNYDDFNVAEQTAVPDSLLSHYRSLVHVRNGSIAMRQGTWEPFNASIPNVYTFLRRSADQTLLVIMNLSGDPIDNYGLCINEGPLVEGAVVDLLGAEVAQPTLNGTGGFEAYKPVAELAPYTTYVLELR
ncbi:MAG: alpha-amylase family glycosyl hydrolase [Chloroflexota bacterium]